MKTLDLHHYRVADVEDALETFIDRAILRDEPMLTIIHGHGTGALRKEVARILRAHRAIARFEPAHSYGATIAYLK